MLTLFVNVGKDVVNDCRNYLFTIGLLPNTKRNQVMYFWQIVTYSIFFIYFDLWLIIVSPFTLYIVIYSDYIADYVPITKV